jgi:hypothetical protein
MLRELGLLGSNFPNPLKPTESTHQAKPLGIPQLLVEEFTDVIIARKKSLGAAVLRNPAAGS